MPRPRLLVADDHQLFIDGLKRLLDPDFEVVAAANDGHAAVQAYKRLQPDIVLLDVGLPVLNGIEAARAIKDINPRARILFVSMHTDRAYVEEAFRAGASGYLVKQCAGRELIDAVQAALRGRNYISRQIAGKVGAAVWDGSKKPALCGGRLTPRQREVLQLIAEGKAMKEIAEILQISVRTVEFHKNAIIEELGVRSTAELTRYALELGIVPQIAKAMTSQMAAC